MMGPLVETDWVADHLGDDNLRILDGSWYLPAMGRNATEEFASSHIPGARYFDIDAISEPDSPLPHTLPSPAYFADQVGALGVSHTDRIVVYDGAGLFSAARVWWMFRTMGAKNVAVLNGGFKAWQAEGRQTESALPEIVASTFEAVLDRDWVCDITTIRSATQTGSHEIADARPGDRFTGEVPEPRAGLRSGHMPSSSSTPIGTFIDGDGKIKAPDGLAAAFSEAGIDIDRPILTTCGSGVTAAIPYLALHLLGRFDVKLYDGSWTEWGGHPDTEVLQGPAGG